MCGTTSSWESRSQGCSSRRPNTICTSSGPSPTMWWFPMSSTRWPRPAGIRRPCVVLTRCGGSPLPCGRAWVICRPTFSISKVSQGRVGRRRPRRQACGSGQRATCGRRSGRPALPPMRSCRSWPSTVVGCTATRGWTTGTRSASSTDPRTPSLTRRCQSRCIPTAGPPCSCRSGFTISQLSTPCRSARRRRSSGARRPTASSSPTTSNPPRPTPAGT